MVNQQPTSLIHTTIGKIAIYQKEVDSNKIPFIFLHGVYFDHHLWDKVIDSVNDRTIIALDMPLHGLSKEITKNDWSLNDCADMLLEILDHLKIAKVIAVGHSWGSMTILRAASKQPERFENVLLCNMPFLAATKKQKITFVLQHSMLIFRNFYTKQVAKALFGKTLFKENPSLIEDLKRPMNLLSNAQIKQTDKAVIIDAEDASELIKNLKVRAIALKGVEDYVPAPPNIETIVIGGGHISPLEKPDEILSLVKKISN
ncbi:MAG: alpha/beta hydrolase [Saprospiraceae bacterium]|nr:alpha/beta hydrolase [Saprospiraceae bacterium]